MDLFELKGFIFILASAFIGAYLLFLSVKKIYSPFSDESISAWVASIASELTPVQVKNSKLMASITTTMLMDRKAHYLVLSLPLGIFVAVLTFAYLLDLTSYESDYLLYSFLILCSFWVVSAQDLLYKWVQVGVAAQSFLLICTITLVMSLLKMISLPNFSQSLFVCLSTLLAIGVAQLLTYIRQGKGVWALAPVDIVFIVLFSFIIGLDFIFVFPLAIISSYVISSIAKKRLRSLEYPLNFALKNKILDRHFLSTDRGRPFLPGLWLSLAVIMFIVKPLEAVTNADNAIVLAAYLVTLMS